MSDTVQTTSFPSILSRNSKPVWDFAATTAYPIELQQKGKTPTVYVYLTPYTPEELKAVLQKNISGYKHEKRDLEVVREDLKIYTPLCDAHFVKLGNATGTPEAQKMWLDKYPELKPSIVRHTFGGLLADEQTDAGDEDTMLDISTELSGAVAVYQSLYDPATDKIIRIDMVHSYQHPTEAQFRDYKGARRNKFLRKGALWAVTENHNTLEKLYDTVIRSVEGGAVSGVFCDEKTKSEWIAGIPLWHKIWIVDRIFGELVEKNV